MPIRIGQTRGRYEPVGYRGRANGQTVRIGTNTYTWSANQDRWNLTAAPRVQTTIPVRTNILGGREPGGPSGLDAGGIGLFDVNITRAELGFEMLGADIGDTSPGGAGTRDTSGLGTTVRQLAAVGGNQTTRGAYAVPEVIVPPIPVIRGCTDRKALNFNPRATVSDNSKCTYKPPKPIVKNTTTSNEKRVTLNFTSNRKGSTVFEVKGKLTGGIPKQFTLSGKELLTPKIFQARTGSSNSVETYKIYSVQRTIVKDLKPILPRPIEEEPPVDNLRFAFDDDGSSRDENALRFRSNLIDGNGGLPYVGQLGIKPFTIPKAIKIPPITIGKATINYFVIFVEKRTSFGKYIPVPISDKIDNKYLTINLPFEINVPDIVIPPKAKIEVEIEANTPIDGLVGYRTSFGEAALLEEDDFVQLQSDSTGDDFIEFIPNGISAFTHTVKYSVVYGSESGKIKSIESLDTKVPLKAGYNKIIVDVVKKGVSAAADEPTISASPNNINFNIFENKPIYITYKTRNADVVQYTLGKTKRELKANGEIRLTKADFTNGVGRYTIFLQPVSGRAGSGDFIKININVSSRQVIPGPDITNINFPQNIQGADFKGYSIPFSVDWQSINTDFVHIYAGKKSNRTFLGKFSSSGSAKFLVSDVLRKAGSNLSENRDISVFNMILQPVSDRGDSRALGKEEKITITFDKGNLKIRRGRLISDIKKAFDRATDESILETDISKLLTHFLHLGEGNNKLISTWGIDTDTLSTFEFNPNTNREDKVKEVKSLVLKLYEPLPTNVSPNDTLWISKIQSIPIIDRITLIEDVLKDCIPLTPNFNLDVGDDIGFQILDDLVASGSATSTDLIQSYVSSSDFDLENLNINFVSQSLIESNSLIVPDGTLDYAWNNFVKYSSAEERVENFFYKIKLLESYQNKYNTLTSGSAFTSSVAVSNEANKQQIKIREVKRGFDAFEKFLYTSSSLSGLTYPGAGLNELSASTDSDTTTWYTTALTSARTFDVENTSRLTNNVPIHIIQDNNSAEFTLFLDMIGQHFDILWVHTNALAQSKNLEHKKDIGISNNLIYHMLESLGWDADMGTKSTALWEFAFGKNSDGTTFSSMSGKDRQDEIWRRLLNNLPYLYKHKGTKRALHAAMSCYGIPASMLSIMEFGGPKDATQSNKVKYTFTDRTSAINISGSENITLPWKEFSNDLSTDYPNSVEIRYKTSTRADQQIVSGSDWSLHLLKDTGSLGKYELRVLSGSTIASQSTPTAPLFNDEYHNVVVNKTVVSGSDNFDILVKEAFNERLRINVTASLETSTVSGWTSGSELKIGGSTLTGSIDEFRLWRTPLSESKVENHAFNPMAIDGNHVSASTLDLIFRNDFEYPKNRNTDSQIKNVAETISYVTASVANDFRSETSYPYNYTPYDREVTAIMPQTGFNYSSKVRLETQTLISNLDYRSRATKKSFDQSPLDSDKLGLFFSPTKEINLDIAKSLGELDIDNYIGNPADEYKDNYSALDKLRKYYFGRYTINIYEYIQLVRYIESSIFDVLESLVPARAKVQSGLLIEPHILERSKTQWTKPSGTEDYHESVVDVTNIEVSSNNPQYIMNISASEDTILTGTNPQYIGTIDTEQLTILSGSKNDFDALISTEDDINLTSTILRNSGSTMGGIEISISAKTLGDKISGEFDSTGFQQVGVGPDSLSVAGFGLYGSGSHAIRTRLDKNNNYVKDRVKVFLVKEQYTIEVPENIDSSDSSRGTQMVSQTKHRFKVNILPFSGSDSVVGGDIVEVRELNGYFPTHYRNTGDLTTGLENSFFNGSKQTSATTLDGGSPVQTFTTNPNTLRVTDSNRGSGEPILEVD